MIRAIFFDCFGVLTESIWKQLLAGLTPEQAAEVTSLHRAYDKGFISYDEFKSEAGTVAHIAGERFDELFVTHPGSHKNTELLRYIAELSRHYKIGIISNVGSAWIRESFLTPTEQALFNDMVLSFEVGMSKPDAEMFTVAAERLKVEPREAVMIDDQEAYCQAATSVGMRAVVYTNFVQLRAELEALLASASDANDQSLAGT